MTIERAKEIVQIGFAWANWTSEQKEAFRTLLLETEKANQLQSENDRLTKRLFALQRLQEEREKHILPPTSSIPPMPPVKPPKVKTFLNDFNEKHPNAPSHNDEELPDIYPCNLGYCEKDDDFCKSNELGCAKCWNRPLKENDNG